MTNSIVKSSDSIMTLLSNVSYKDWAFKLRSHAGGFLLSVIVDLDTVNKIDGISTRYKKPLAITEWYISRYATDTEVVRTVYKAVMYIEMFIVEHSQFLDLDLFSELTFDSPEMGDRERVGAMLSTFKYKDWNLRSEERDGGLMLQIIFNAPDNDDPTKVEEQHCRKFFYDYSGFNELYLTIQHAVRMAEEHECNELFKYKGKQIYNPHMDLDAIVEFINANAFDHR